MASNERTQFFAFFVGGAAAIALLKVLSDSLWFAPVAASAALCAYAWCVWDWEERESRFDGAGDYVYYLGFLYTLISLAASLALVGSRLGDDPALIRGVVTGFGVAIISTILGMALRVLMGRGSDESPPAVVERAELGLAAAGRRLRGELDYTVSEFKDFRQRIREGLEQSVAEATAASALAGERAISAAESVTQVEAKAIEAGDRLIERVEELSGSARSLDEFEATTKRLAAAASSVADAADRDAQEMGVRTRAVGDALGEQVSRIASIDLGKTMEARLAELTALEGRLVQAAAAVEEGVNRLNTGWARRGEEVDAAAREATRLSSSFRQVTSTLEGLQAAVAGMDETAAALRAFAAQVSRAGETGSSTDERLVALYQRVSESEALFRELNAQVGAVRDAFAAAPGGTPRRRRWRFWR